jgi:hypothetical protein
MTSRSTGAPVADTTGEIAEGLMAQICSAAERVRGIRNVRGEFHTGRGDPYSGLVTAAGELTADDRGGGLGVDGPPVHRVDGGTVGEGGALAGDRRSVVVVSVVAVTVTGAVER